MRSTLTGAVLLTLAAIAPVRRSAGQRSNILELPHGTLVTSVSSSYGGNWTAANLADGSTGAGWSSAQGAPLPHIVVFELQQPYAITGVAVDNTGDQEDGYAGISSRRVNVYGSATSVAAGFTQLAAFEAPRGGRMEVKLGAPVTAQWLKFVVSSNWGNAAYTEITELEAYGEPVGPPPTVDVGGVYATDYGPMRIEQDGTNIVGCYGQDRKLFGNRNGRVMQLEWREDHGKRVGTAVMVLSAKGDALTGEWFEHGQLRGEWSGQRGTNAPSCTVAPGNPIAERLASTGRIGLYGIYFASDSASLKPASDKTLNEVLAVLQAQPALTLVVAGHTDSTSTEAYNLKLSQQRAEAVVAWLVTRGVAASRLTAKGLGKSQPVANNATAAGRALNRRVELVKQ